MRDSWGSDLPVSMPVPPAVKPEVPMDGFGFGRKGLCHDITEEERDALAIPTFAPAEEE